MVSVLSGPGHGQLIMSRAYPLSAFILPRVYRWRFRWTAGLMDYVMPLDYRVSSAAALSAL